MKKNLAFLSVIILLLSIISLGLYYFYKSYQESLETLYDSYATWDSGRMLVAYLYKHNKWPKNWNDLEPIFEEINKKGPLPFNEIKKRINIDFSVDLHKLNIEVTEKSQKLPQRIISLKNGTDQYWEGKEPNKILLRYLISGDKEKAIGNEGILLKENLKP